jgi:3-hydroxybutyryl-CoA dehydrogenase
MAAIDRHAPADAVVSTNTSALSITEMAGARRMPPRGRHALLQSGASDEARRDRARAGVEPEALETVEAVARQMGRTPSSCASRPGSSPSRVNASIGNEAFFMLMEGRGVGARHRQGAEARA